MAQSATLISTIGHIVPIHVFYPFLSFQAVVDAVLFHIAMSVSVNAVKLMAWLAQMTVLPWLCDALGLRFLLRPRFHELRFEDILGIDVGAVDDPGIGALPHEDGADAHADNDRFSDESDSDAEAVEVEVHVSPRARAHSSDSHSPRRRTSSAFTPDQGFALLRDMITVDDALQVCACIT